MRIKKTTNVGLELWKQWPSDVKWYLLATGRVRPGKKGRPEFSDDLTAAEVRRLVAQA